MSGVGATAIEHKVDEPEDMAEFMNRNRIFDHALWDRGRCRTSDLVDEHREHDGKSADDEAGITLPASHRNLKSSMLSSTNVSPLYWF